MTTYKLLLLPGDGIGPEVMAEVKRLLGFLARSGIATFATEEGLVGGASYDTHSVAITDETMAKAHAADAVIFGAVGGPKWDNVAYEVRPEAGLLRLRKDLGLFANIRPAICYPALADSSSLKREAVKGSTSSFCASSPAASISASPRPSPTWATARSAPSIRRSTILTRSSASRASASSLRASGATRSPRWRSAT